MGRTNAVDVVGKNIGSMITKEVTQCITSNKKQSSMPTQKQVSWFDDLLTDEIEIKPSKDILQKIIDHIKEHLNPDDIWDDDVLREYVAKTSLPEDVFPDKKLEDWAESNGYIKSE